MRPVFVLVAALLPVVHGALLLGIPSEQLAAGNTSVPSSFSKSAAPVSTFTSSANSSISNAPPTSPAVGMATVPRKRAAIPACLKTVELSCLNLAANCIDSVNAGNVNTLWSIKSCVAAATCYGVGDLITSVECQTGFVVTNSAQAALPSSIYNGIVMGCTSCAITQQNYIDFYYGQLTAVNSANFPSSIDVVKAFWSAITTWAATGSTVPYMNFNDWLHFSSFPVTTTTTTTPVTTFTQITWNPNPAPTSGAVSETFVTSTITVIIAIPTATTSVVVGGISITLAPGGTPINNPLPPGITIPGATTPTWNPNIIPPTSVPSVTFTAPPSFTTIVAVPAASNSPPKNITGPPGDKNSDGDNWWLLVFPGVIGGLLPADIGIPGGVKPTAAPPPDWTGAWTDPDPTSTSTHNSGSASSSTTTTPVIPYTQITWNPNPAPTSGAVSETFVKSPTTVIIAIPTATTSVVVGGTSIKLAPGGTPINSPLPPGISIPGATTPLWNPNIIPPTSVPSVTFTAPPSFTTIVAVPTASNSPPKNITGPPGDKNSDGDNWWLLVFPGVIDGLLPADIGIPGGVKPTAAPPPDWTGVWTDPDPTSTSTHNSASASSSASSSSSSCPQPTAAYSLSDDDENSDWEDLGSDPDRRRSNIMTNVARAGGRSMAFTDCEINKANGNLVTNPITVDLKAGTYYTIGTKAAGGIGIALNPIVVNDRPVGNGGGTVAQEHVFEIGYIGQFFKSIKNQGVSCAWIVNNVYDQDGWDGRKWALSLLQEIDQVPNMVWVDKAMNQGMHPKSNVVNQNKATAADPPQMANIKKISDFTTTSSVNLIQDIEYFIRNLAAVGTYFGHTAAIFQATALRVQNCLAQITPNTPDVNLPVAFNVWLRTLIQTYPLGCTSRATNSFNYYHNRMTTVANQLNNGVVPQCFPLFPVAINPTTFTWQNLVPPPPNLPTCNIPGTEGILQLGVNPNGAAEKGVDTYRVMGAGHADFYGLGIGTDFMAGSHFVAGSLAQYPSCGNGAVVVDLTGPGTPAGLPDVLFSPQCNGQTGKQTVPFSFVLNGQTLSCTLIVTVAGKNSPVEIICAGSAAVAVTCANFFLSNRYPTGHLLTGPMMFIPS